jgi:hypothetical protein
MHYLSIHTDPYSVYLSIFHNATKGMSHIFVFLVVPIYYSNVNHRDKLAQTEIGTKFMPKIVTHTYIFL